MRIAIRELGPRGERRAAWFYRLRGYRIIDRNVRMADGEIDLIVSRGGLVVFAEVKARQQERLGAPWEAVDRQKQLRMIRLAERYIDSRKLHPERIRFDVVSLVWTGWRFRLEHFADAFYAEYEPGRPWRMV